MTDRITSEPNKEIPFDEIILAELFQSIENIEFSDKD